MRLYIYGAILLAFVAIFAAAAVYRGNAIKAEAETARLEKELSIVRAVNKSNLDVIDKITAARRRDDKLLSDLADKVETIAQDTAELNAARNEVERGNANVSDYLNQPIPDELKRLYNNP